MITIWLLLGGSFVLGLWAQHKVKGTFAEYSRYTTRAGLTGAQVAQRILATNNIRDVRVERVAGRLSDHYDPRAKVLRLSGEVHDGRSMAAFGVAAHEVGHALQHARSYGPLGFRSAWVPFANLGGGISMGILVLALLMGGTATPTGTLFAYAGLLAFGTTTLFTLVTLPVEFDASRRALKALTQGGLTTPEETAGARKVLGAAALTYVAAFVTSLATLLYWAQALGVLGGRNRE